MRHLAAVVVLVGVLPAACGSAGQANLDSSGVGTTGSDIIGGTLDATDRSVLEIFYDTSYPVSACNGSSTCLQSCLDATTGKACTSGATCSCGTGASCTGELIGPHTVVTAGHCTDLSAGGEVGGPGSPALTVCSSLSDVMAVAGHTPTSNGCNLAIFVLFNNACMTNDIMGTCESRLLSAGNFVIADSTTNPGYDGSDLPPYSATNNDDDIGLLHLASSTLQNGQVEPGILTFNRSDLGAACFDLGSLRFVGYGVTDPSQGANAISGVKYEVTDDVRVKDAWHNEEDGAQTSVLSTCGPGSSDGPTCSGDSGGPSFNSAGVIIGVTSLGDPNCSIYAQDTRIDAYADWIDAKMAAWGDPKNGASGASDAGGANSQCAADCGVTTAKDADGGAAADGSVRTVQGGDSGAADGADTQRGSPDADDAHDSGGSVGRNGGGGCTVGAARSGSTGRGTMLIPLMFAAAFLFRRRRVVSPLSRHPRARLTRVDAHLFESGQDEIPTRGANDAGHRPFLDRPVSSGDRRQTTRLVGHPGVGDVLQQSRQRFRNGRPPRASHDVRAEERPAEARVMDLVLDGCRARRRARGRSGFRPGSAAGTRSRPPR